MIDNRIVNKSVHVDDIKKVKTYLDEKQDEYEVSTTNHINETINQNQTELNISKTQIETDLNTFKTQIESSFNDFKNQVENDIYESSASIGGPTVVELNLELIPSGTAYSSNTNTSGLSIFGKNMMPYRRSKSVDYADTNTIRELINTHSQCTVIINDDRICMGETSNSGLIYIKSAGLRISIGSSSITTTQYNISTSGSSESIKLTRLEFRGA